jgi:hypothetical protein
MRKSHVLLIMTGGTWHSKNPRLMPMHLEFKERNLFTVGQTILNDVGRNCMIEKNSRTSLSRPFY